MLDADGSLHRGDTRVAPRQRRYTCKGGGIVIYDLCFTFSRVPLRRDQRRTHCTRRYEVCGRAFVSPQRR